MIPKFGVKIILNFKGAVRIIVDNIECECGGK